MASRSVGHGSLGQEEHGAAANLAHHNLVPKLYRMASRRGVSGGG
jgi:hypothetical protein